MQLCFIHWGMLPVGSMKQSWTRLLDDNGCDTSSFKATERKLSGNSDRARSGDGSNFGSHVLARVIQRVVIRNYPLNLSPTSLKAIANNIKSPQPLDTLLNQLNRDFAVPLLALCYRIAKLDGKTTPVEARVIERSPPSLILTSTDCCLELPREQDRREEEKQGHQR